MVLYIYCYHTFKGIVFERQLDDEKRKVGLELERRTQLLFGDSVDPQGFVAAGFALD